MLMVSQVYPGKGLRSHNSGVCELSQAADRNSIKPQGKAIGTTLLFTLCLGDILYCLAPSPLLSLDFTGVHKMELKQCPTASRFPYMFCSGLPGIHHINDLYIVKLHQCRHSMLLAALHDAGKWGNQLT